MIKFVFMAGRVRGLEEFHSDAGGVFYTGAEGKRGEGTDVELVNITFGLGRKVWFWGNAARAERGEHATVPKNIQSIRGAWE